MRYAKGIDDALCVTHSRDMDHIAHIWTTMAELAADLGKPYPTVAAWKARGRIPADYDADLIAAAERRGFVLTYEDLARARRAAPAQSQCQRGVA